MDNFQRIKKLPKYVFNVIDDFKQQARQKGTKVIDLGMGNPDLPPPEHVMARLQQALAEPGFHRYSVSRGIDELREAVCQWYQDRYTVSLCHDTEAVVCLGSKEGLSHLAMAVCNPGDNVLIPSPCYPIHYYGFVIAGGQVVSYPAMSADALLADIEQALTNTWPKPKAMVLNFPSNPTTLVVDLDFYAQVVKLAKAHKVWIIQDLAYADLNFDGYRAPSILQVPGAKDIAVETFSLSKSYSLPGMRIGFVCGNPTLVGALAHIKTYMDYGIFYPIQQAAVAALTGPQDYVEQIRECYQQRRDVLCKALNDIGWTVEPPKATMFVWAKIPELYQHMDSLTFCQYLIEHTGIAVAPGIGFGELGDDHVRFGLIEDKQVMLEACDALDKLFKRDQQGVA